MYITENHLKDEEKRQALINFIIINAISFTLIYMFGEYLWNNILVRLVPAIRPVEGITDLMGLSALFQILI